MVPGQRFTFSRVCSQLGGSMPGGSASAAPAGTATSPATTPATRATRPRCERWVLIRRTPPKRERDAGEEAAPPHRIRQRLEYRDQGPELRTGVPETSVPLAKLGFLTIGLFDGDDPAPGH